MDTAVLPLSKRKFDILLIAFFSINLFFVVYIIDVEQLVIADPADFTYPLWPPKSVVDLIHWYGNTFDPLLMARPAWWRACIWIDVLFFGPFYAFAIYAYWKGKNRIRLASIIWATMMLTNQVVILFEEAAGEHASPELGYVLLANSSWVIFPLLVLYRMWPSPFPFSSR